VCVLYDKQKPGKKGQGESGWTVQAKLDIYLWLGEYDSRTLDQPYMLQLPPGYEPQYLQDDRSKPPISITYAGTGYVIRPSTPIHRLYFSSPF